METLECTVVLGLIDPKSEVTLRGDLIGVDAGAYYCLTHGYQMKLSIGDFDSIDSRHLANIQKASEQFIKLDPIKDVSDFEAALEYLDGYQTIYVYGGIGGRLDHQYSILTHVRLDSRIRLLNENNYLYVLEAGEHQITKERYRYLSLFALEPSKISVSGVKYPLESSLLDVNDTYTLSNEILADNASLIINFGRLLVIQSDDK